MLEELGIPKMLNDAFVSVQANGELRRIRRITANDLSTK